jgi:hypothetical protein
VLLISGYEDGAIAHEAITQARGAAGFLSEEAEIAAAIIQVANGRSALSPNTVKTYWQRLYEKLEIFKLHPHVLDHAGQTCRCEHSHCCGHQQFLRESPRRRRC